MGLLFVFGARIVSYFSSHPDALADLLGGLAILGMVILAAISMVAIGLINAARKGKDGGASSCKKSSPSGPDTQRDMMSS